MGRILGIDFGIARVGLAMTDLLKITAQPLDTLNINGNVDLLIDKAVSRSKEKALEMKDKVREKVRGERER